MIKLSFLNFGLTEGSFFQFLRQPSHSKGSWSTEPSQRRILLQILRWPSLGSCDSASSPSRATLPPPAYPRSAGAFFFATSSMRVAHHPSAPWRPMLFHFVQSSQLTVSFLSLSTVISSTFWPRARNLSAILEVASWRSLKQKHSLLSSGDLCTTTFLNKRVAVSLPTDRSLRDLPILYNRSSHV